jgi:hypothetical protein
MPYTTSIGIESFDILVGDGRTDSLELYFSRIRSVGEQIEGQTHIVIPTREQPEEG